MGNSTTKLTQTAKLTNLLDGYNNVSSYDYTNDIVSIGNEIENDIIDLHDILVATLLPKLIKSLYSDKLIIIKRDNKIIYWNYEKVCSSKIDIKKFGEKHIDHIKYDSACSKKCKWCRLYDNKISGMLSVQSYNNFSEEFNDLGEGIQIKFYKNRIDRIVRGILLYESNNNKIDKNKQNVINHIINNYYCRASELVVRRIISYSLYNGSSVIYIPMDYTHNLEKMTNFMKYSYTSYNAIISIVYKIDPTDSLLVPKPFFMIRLLKNKN